MRGHNGGNPILVTILPELWKRFREGEACLAMEVLELFVVYRR